MYNVIVNPIAGNGKASKVIKKVSKYFKSQNVEFLVYFSENEQDVLETTKKLCKNGERDFIIIGGDGTLHGFINGLTDPSKTNFGIVPAGQHNHFARYLSIPKNPVDAVKNILEHPTIKIDYLKCNEYRALNTVSAGAIESAQKQYLSQDNTSNLPYRKILKNTLKTFEGVNLAIESDNGKIKDKSYTACAICNGGFYGDNMYVSPLSNMHDGLANLITINYQDNLKVKKDYSTVKQGKHIYKDVSSNTWASFVNIKSKQPFDAMLDGELYEFNDLQVNVISNGLNIYTKK